ncbi:Uncharacterised protein [Citrobacter youngae]|uniref:Uncharacterized protein n=1 Tax=Citrobacter youngae TaxID=133448 RepID=A0A9Q7ZLI5_9ENTR|nr:Uncharacterised protein [Citrobacter youngae]
MYWLTIDAMNVTLRYMFTFLLGCMAVKWRYHQHEL